MSDTETGNKPGIVTNTLFLLYLYLASGVIVWVIVLPRIAEQHGLWAGDVYFLAFFVLGFLVGFILEFRKGKNWARFALIVFYALMGSLSVAVTFRSPSDSPFQSLMFCLHVILGVIACVYVGHPDVSVWCKEMKQVRELRLRRLLSMDFGNDANPWDGASPDEPLLVVQYHGYKHVWRIIWPICPIVVFGGVALWGDLGKDQHFVLSLLAHGVFGILAIGGIWMLIEALLFREIRLYRDRIALVRHLIGAVEVGLAEASYEAREVRIRYGRPKPVWICKGDMNIWRARFRGIFYERNLMAAKDLEVLNRLLAALTGRPVAEFRKGTIKMRRLMSTDEVPNSCGASR